MIKTNQTKCFNLWRLLIAQVNSYVSQYAFSGRDNRGATDSGPGETGSGFAEVVDKFTKV